MRDFNIDPMGVAWKERGQNSVMPPPLDGAWGLRSAASVIGNGNNGVLLVVVARDDARDLLQGCTFIAMQHLLDH